MEISHVKLNDNLTLGNTRHTMPMRRGQSVNEGYNRMTTETSQNSFNDFKRVYAWGQNREGQLSVRSNDLVEQVVNRPTRVFGLKGQHWPVRIASG